MSKIKSILPLSLLALIGSCVCLLNLSGCGAKYPPTPIFPGSHTSIDSEVELRQKAHKKIKSEQNDNSDDEDAVKNSDSDYYNNNDNSDE